MNNERALNRWYIVIASIVIQMCLGAVYAFSVLVPPLESEFNWTRIQTSPAFTVALLVFALSMIPAGKLQDKRGPRLVATMGGIALGVGMILSSFTTSLVWFYLSYGVIGGLGIGLTYVTPITTCTKWFPDKKGLVSGLAVFGFGAGSIIFAPLWTFLISALGWRVTFLVTGLLFSLLVIPAAQLLKNPRPEYLPPNWTPTTATTQTSKDVGSGRMLRSIKFYLIWASYWFGTTAGLMVIGSAKQASMELALLSSFQASLIVSLLGLFNAIGRIIWGFLGDRIGRTNVLTIIFAVCSGGLLLAATVPAAPLFVIGIFMIGLSFGGFLAIYPALTSDYYGTRNLGINYGLVFTAYGAGAVLGPVMAGYFKTFANSYIPPFYIASILAIAGIALSILFKRFPNLTE